MILVDSAFLALKNLYMLLHLIITTPKSDFMGFSFFLPTSILFFELFIYFSLGSVYSNSHILQEYVTGNHLDLEDFITNIHHFLLLILQCKPLILYTILHISFRCFVSLVNRMASSQIVRNMRSGSGT